MKFTPKFELKFKCIVATLPNIAILNTSSTKYTSGEINNTWPSSEYFGIKLAPLAVASMNLFRPRVDNGELLFDPYQFSLIIICRRSRYRNFENKSSFICNNIQRLCTRRVSTAAEHIRLNGTGNIYQIKTTGRFKVRDRNKFQYRKK